MSGMQPVKIPITIELGFICERFTVKVVQVTPEDTPANAMAAINKIPPLGITPENEEAVLEALRAMRRLIYEASGVYTVRTGYAEHAPWHTGKEPTVSTIGRIVAGITAAGLDYEPHRQPATNLNPCNG